MTGPSLSRNRALGQSGFSATELIVVVAVIGILMAGSVPFLLSTWRTSALRAGAEELATVLGQARQMAIKDNKSVCAINEVGFDMVQNGRVIRYRIGSCPAGDLWIGPGMEGDGFIRLSNNIEAWPPGQSVLFTYIGTATAPAAFSVRNPQDGQTLNVCVIPSGRIFIRPSTAPCP
jgi:prepilin-type N-terminal cleavage/methylation domain-containing protein